MNDEYGSAVFLCMPDKFPEEFYIITGWNPMGVNACLSDNLDRDKKVEHKVSVNPHFRIIGMSQDEKHAEPSWGVVCSEDFVLKVAAEFQQEAIFHVLNDKLTLISADGKFRQGLGAWKDRVRDPRRMLSFNIYVGSRVGSAKINEVDRQTIVDMVKAKFTSFSIFEGEGYFRSDVEESILIKISTDQPQKILILSRELRSMLAQDGIGVECRGIYQRVTAWSDDQMLLDAWGV